MGNINEKLMKNLTKLTELETNNLAIKSAIFVRKITEKIDMSIKEIELRINEEIEFYGQNPENYLEYKKATINKYAEEFKKFSEEYELQYINIIQELQETYANQKISIANCKKMKNFKDEYLESNKYQEYKQIKAKYKEDMDNSLTKEEFERNMNLLKNLKNPIDEYDTKIKACIEKAKDYELIIEKCNEKLEECKQKAIEELNNYVSNKTSQLVIYKKNNIISKIINKITNIFKGKQKVQTYVIDKTKQELNTLETDANNTKNNIRENTINLIEQLIGIREEVNHKFSENIKA